MTNHIQHTDTFTVAQAAELLQRSHSTILSWIYGGHIQAQRSGLAPQSPWIISGAELARVVAMLDGQAQQAPQAQ